MISIKFKPDFADFRRRQGFTLCRFSNRVLGATVTAAAQWFLSRDSVDMISSTSVEGKRRVASPKRRPLFHGAPVGILLLERARDSFDRPWIPGHVGNASTWSVPVRYKTVPDLTVGRILGPEAEGMTAAVTQAAIELVHEGAQLITSNCGFAIKYQKAVSAAVDVPVLLSSLLLIPFLASVLPKGKALGIVTASSSSLTPDVLRSAAMPDDSDRIVIVGLESAPAFSSACLTCSADLDVSAVENEVVDAAVALVDSRPDIGMLLLECADLPPYAALVQRATGVPVFDYTSMVEFFAQGLNRRPFNGLD